MATAPRFYTLGARDPACDLRFAKGVSYLTNDGCGHLVLDIGSTTTRPSTKDDVAAAARVCDHLSAVSFLWPMVSAQDHGATAPLHEIDAMWSNSVKHVQGFVHGAAAARRAVEMATIVAGGETARRARPPLSAMVCTVSPLMQDREAIEAALEFAAAGIPVGFTSMPTMGTTAPATMAGLLAVADAEVVSATVLVQLAAPGAPVFHSILPATCDPRTGAYVPKPLNRYGRQAVVEIAHHWGVPSQVGAFGTGSREPGTWQAAAESGLDLYLVALAGADMIAGIGLLDGSTVLALDSLLLDADLYHRTRYALQRLPIDDETLALDTVTQVGPGGHYLGTKHTRRHLRDTVVPGLQHETGPDGEYRDPLAVARERVACDPRAPPSGAAAGRSARRLSTRCSQPPTARPPDSDDSGAPPSQATRRRRLERRGAPGSPPCRCRRRGRIGRLPLVAELLLRLRTLTAARGGPMKVLVVGGGGREHALVHAFASSNLATQLYCAPGNAGIAQEAECVPIGGEDIEALLAFARGERIDLTVVGPEAPLVAGVADAFEDNGLAVFGPSRAAAQLEGSKLFAKQIMADAGAPTGGYARFTDHRSALDHLAGASYPLVVKADGLAAGKGVTVAQTRDEAQAAVEEALVARRFGLAGEVILIEEFLAGPEVSLLALCDGTTVVPMAPAQDYKRIFAGDQGPNTGGMGSYCPVPGFSSDTADMIVEEIFQPVLAALVKRGIWYRGVLYGGLIVTDAGTKILEFNVRFGDPETQAILPRLDSDLLERVPGHGEGRASRSEARLEARRLRLGRHGLQGLPRVELEGRRHQRPRRGRRHGRRGRLPRRHGVRGRSHRHGRRPRPRRERARRVVRRRPRPGLRRGEEDLVPGHAVAARHRRARRHGGAGRAGALPARRARLRHRERDDSSRMTT